jgi:hypothetical protein
MKTLSYSKWLHGVHGVFYFSSLAAGVLLDGKAWNGVLEPSGFCCSRGSIRTRIASNKSTLLNMDSVHEQRVIPVKVILPW